MYKGSQILSDDKTYSLSAKLDGKGGHGEIVKLVQWSEEQESFNTKIDWIEDLVKIEAYKMQNCQIVVMECHFVYSAFSTLASFQHW